MPALGSMYDEKKDDGGWATAGGSSAAAATKREIAKHEAAACRGGAKRLVLWVFFASQWREHPGDGKRRRTVSCSATSQEICIKAAEMVVTVTPVSASTPTNANSPPPAASRQ